MNISHTTYGSRSKTKRVITCIIYYCLLFAFSVNFSISRDALENRSDLFSISKRIVLNDSNSTEELRGSSVCITGSQFSINPKTTVCSVYSARLVGYLPNWIMFTMFVISIIAAVVVEFISDNSPLRLPSVCTETIISSTTATVAVWKVSNVYNIKCFIIVCLLQILLTLMCSIRTDDNVRSYFFSINIGLLSLVIAYYSITLFVSKNSLLNVTVAVHITSLFVNVLYSNVVQNSKGTQQSNAFIDYILTSLKIVTYIFFYLYFYAYL